MGISKTQIRLLATTAVAALIGALSLSGDTPASAPSGAASFVRTGLNIQIAAARIAANGTVSVDFKIADSKGLGLDRTGVQTPGTVTLSFLIASIPRGERQYRSYITRTRSSTDGTVTATQATSENNGTFQQRADGEYTYTFATKVPTTFDGSATHRLAIYGNRNLTEFDLGISYDDAFYDWVPAGGTPAPRDVVRTESCNKCHDQLAAHGGSRRSVQVCVVCHQTQTTEPNSGNTVNFPVMVHKIHMGSQLPSVKAGTPYRIGGGANPSDFSTVVFPSDPRRCESCHDGNSGAAQADAWLTNPNRAACGGCHDDVNFATGANHVDLPQVSDNQCTNCHIQKGETELDASIRGAHTIPAYSESRPGIVADILKVENGRPGQKPTITFTLRDFSGNAIPLSALNSTPNRVSLNLAGVTTDYGTATFAGVTTPGYVTENPATTGTCMADGMCTYTFTRAIPADAKGTYAIGIEARRALVVMPGTVKQVSTQYSAPNKVMYFSVDGSPVVKRRQVVDIAKCNGCHTDLQLHGTNRNRTEYCVFCHNANNAASNPAQGINFAFMVHRIHTGEKLQEAGQSFKIGTTEFNDVRYPVMSPNGATGDTAKCGMCHVNGSEANFPTGLTPVKDPQGLLNPAPATTSACTACHFDSSAVAHAVSQTDARLGESCTVCHGANADFSVSKVHAGK